MKILIIGGVAGGASAAARLRRLDEKAEIIIFERGEYISYANCGLPYYIGGEITDKNALTLQTPQSFYSRFRIDVRILNEVTAIDRENKTVTVKNIAENKTYTESYDKLVIATGASPIVPLIKGIDSSDVFTLRNIPDTFKIKSFIKKNKPKTAVVVGGGYIGVEMAENLTNAGLAVTIVERSDHLIASLDGDLACDVHGYLRANEIKVILNSAVSEFVKEENGLKIILTGGEIFADMAIMSVGVRPENELAKECDLDINARGSIIVDEHMRTSDENIFAAGDVAEVKNFVTGEPDFIPLAGPANRQGRIVADNICGINSRYKKTQGTSVLKIFDMTVASTGITEEKAKSLGLDFDKIIIFAPSHAGYYPGGSSMSVKVVFEKPSGKILGAQLVGYDGVDKRCDVFALAIRVGMTAFELVDFEHSYAPPFSSAKDPVNTAGFMIENILNGLVKQFFWQDVEELQENRNITLLDVRTAGEYARGHFCGSVNIPLDSLRENLEEIDKTKPVYVNCQSGLRSYIACRILTQNGFDCFNLAGGYRLYNSVMTNSGFDDKPKHPCGAEK